MKNVLISKLFNFLADLSWKAIAYILVVVFSSTWGALYFIEGKVDMVKPENYWWYFISVINFLDAPAYQPTTRYGELVELVIAIFGLAVLSTIITRFAKLATVYSNNVRKGLAKLRKMKEHAIFLGYHPGATEEIIRGIKSHRDWDKRKFIICTDDIDDHPMPDDASVVFRHGDPSDDTLLKELSIHDASRVIIRGKDDRQTLDIAIAANALAGETTKIIVYVCDPSFERRFRQITDKRHIHVQASLFVHQTVCEICNPQATQLIAELMHPESAISVHTLEIPMVSLDDSVTFERLGEELRDRFGALLYGVAENGSRPELNPSPKRIVRPGDTIHYMATRPINADPQIWLQVFEKKSTALTEA